MKPRSEEITDLPVSEVEVREQLRLLLTSELFRGSKRCVAFLEYVVHQRLAGASDNLREKVIGVEAFGRSAGYDSNDDPVVRVTAGEVRKRLAQYYQDPVRSGELRVELIAGSYVPEFHPAPTLPTDIAIVATLPEAARPSPPASKPGRRPWLVTLVSAAAAGLITWQMGWLGSSSFERFWEPSLATPGPILLCTGQSRVYSIRKDLATKVESALDPRKSGKPAHVLPEGLEVTARDLIPAWDRYVPLGDAVSMSNTAIFLEKRKHDYRVRGSADTRLGDLREGAAILFGAFSNDWTLRMNKDLRFHLDLRPDGRRQVVDSQRPDQLKWVGPMVNGPFDAEYSDYAIVTRIFDKTTGHPVISVGGITHLATQAGGEFLLSASLMNEALASAPSGWESRNLQIVITTKVIGSSASPPQFLALHVW
jgi:hypothetical protein